MNDDHSDHYDEEIDDDYALLADHDYEDADDHDNADMATEMMVKQNDVV